MSTYVKPFILDRKNFLLANTPKGVAGSTVMFKTAMENRIFHGRSWEGIKLEKFM